MFQQNKNRLLSDLFLQKVNETKKKITKSFCRKPTAKTKQNYKIHHISNANTAKQEVENTNR